MHFECIYIERKLIKISKIRDFSYLFQNVRNLNDRNKLIPFLKSEMKIT